MQLTVTMKNSGLIKRFIKMFPDEVAIAMDENAAWGTARIRRDTPHGKSSGKAFQTWDWRKVSLLVREIFNPMFYVKFLETGTGRFGPLKKRIVSKSGGPLHWVGLTKTFKRGARKGETLYRNRMSNKKGGYKETDIFVMSTEGMPAQPMIEPNKNVIVADLKKRLRLRIKSSWILMGKTPDETVK